MGRITLGLAFLPPWALGDRKRRLTGLQRAAELSGQNKSEEERMLTRLVPPPWPSFQNSPQILAQPELQVLGCPMVEEELGVGG